MTRADQIKSSFNHKTMNYKELLDESREIAVDMEEDCGIETFTYADGSVAVFIAAEQDICVYGCN